MKTPTRTRPHGQVLAEQPLDDRRHQRGLRRRDGRRTDAEHLVQIERRPADDRGRRHDADDEAELLVVRCRADEISGLQVLRRAAGVGRGNADDGADADRDRAVGFAGPAERDKQQAREDQRRDRHPRNRIGRRADEARDARRDRDEQKPEHDDQNRREEIALHRHLRRQGEEDGEEQRPDEHEHGRDVALGAERRRAARADRRSPSGLRAPTPRSSGACGPSVISPAASTAPAPM